MNILFFTKANKNIGKYKGIYKKMYGQIETMKQRGINVVFTYYYDDYLIIENNNEIEKYLLDSDNKKIELILNKIKDLGIDIIMLRYQPADYYFIDLLKKIKQKFNHKKVILDIPTYPYDDELNKDLLFVDMVLRKRLKRYVDIILNYYGHKKIYGVNSISISNGISVQRINKLSFVKNDDFNMICVANISKWHGYDRIIKGLKKYYDKKTIEKKVYFHVVGNGDEIVNLQNLTKTLELDEYVIFHGIKDGKELDNLFNVCDIAVSSLGMHRIGLYKGSNLKSQEYCARGIPFILSYEDSSFYEGFKYILKFTANEESINIDKCIEFYNKISKQNYNEDMREYAYKNLDWEKKLEPLIDYINQNGY